MKTLVGATVTVVVLALTGGCAIKVDSAHPGPEAPSTSTPSSEQPAVIDSEACKEVRVGIGAFNVGDFAETVAHFEKALPLAEEQDDGSASAGQLVEAVRYYAELDADLYSEASRSSPEFAKYKAITLGQCVAGADESSESPGVQV